MHVGATVVGSRPLRSPSLSNYPYCDREVLRLADALWGNTPDHEGMVQRSIGSGRLITGHALASMSLYPDYDALAAIFRPRPSRPTSRPSTICDSLTAETARPRSIFVANGQPTAVRSECTFRVAGRCRALGCGDRGKPPRDDLPPARGPHKRYPRSSHPTVQCL